MDFIQILNSCFSKEFRKMKTKELGENIHNTYFCQLYMYREYINYLIKRPVTIFKMGKNTKKLHFMISFM